MKHKKEIRHKPTVIVPRPSWIQKMNICRIFAAPDIIACSTSHCRMMASRNEEAQAEAHRVQETYGGVVYVWANKDGKPFIHNSRVISS